MSTDEKNIKKLNKPKIISIIKVDKPIKLMKLNEKSGNNENKNTNVVDNHVPLNDASNIQNIKENFKEVDMPKNSIKSLSDNIIISATSIQQNENKSKTFKSEKYEKTKEANVSKKNCMKSTKEKENKITIDKKKVKSVTIKSPNLDILKHKNRLYSSSTNTKKLNATNKKSISVTTKKNSKPIVGVMPCYKYKKVESKTPVKKTVIRDIIGSKIKPCINPGIEKTADNLKFLEIDENIHVKPLICGKELAKPEYNSIMYTISKLNELKKQKVITDIEHLPASYKNLISGKVIKKIIAYNYSNKSYSLIFSISDFYCFRFST